MAPITMRGAKAIAEHLNMTSKAVEHLHRQRHLPTFLMPHDSAMHATVGGLNEWRQAVAVRLLG